MASTKTKVRAGILAAVSLAFGLMVAIPAASAAQGGGKCNNYGNNNIIIAPNCGAQGATPSGSADPSTVPRTTVTPTLQTLRPYPTGLQTSFPSTSLHAEPVGPAPTTRPTGVYCQAIGCPGSPYPTLPAGAGPGVLPPG